MASPSLTVRVEHWPIAGSFTISRGTKTHASVIVAELEADGCRGRGECVPYARYGESLDGVLSAINAMAPAIANGLDRESLQREMPPGAARNALDCAFWDLAAKRAKRPVHALAGLPAPQPLTTAFTISLASPNEMAMQAERAAGRPLLKIKLGAPGDSLRIAAVRRAAPSADLIVDANEGWLPDDLAREFAACADAGVVLIEQPLPGERDEFLRGIDHPVPICADESVHSRASLSDLLGKYDAINIKLDKTGGLTEALALASEVERLGLTSMTGCMVATSLAMAPALLVAQHTRFVDLDGPLLLARDRPAGLRYDGSIIYPPTPDLWG